MSDSSFRFETLALHAGQTPDPTTGARGVPVYRTSSYVFRDTKHAADLFALREPGNIYTRIMNPTQDVLEKRVAALDGGAAALALASGTSAVHYTVINICRAGDEIVSANNLYGGTYTMFDVIHPQLGIKTNFAAPTPEAIEAAITEKTKLIFIETIGNPGLDVADIEAIARVAQKHHLPLVVDSTFTTPYLLRPIEYGADIVIHSATKYIGGHGDTIGGVIIGPADFIKRAKGEILRDLGGCLSPFNAWLFVRGLKTLPVRMERHQFNAMRIAHYLSFHPKVARVYYPGLRIHPQHELARKQMTGFGGVLSFELKGGRAAGEKLMDSVKLMTLAVSLGDCDTLIEHPASMTHSTYKEEDLLACGITPGLVRLSVGIEAVEDLINDLSQALRKIK